MNNKAREKIEKCRQNRSTRLDLSGFDLKTIPPEVSEFTWLTGLYLEFNQISNIDALQNLKALTHLNLNSNQISNIDALQNLKSLTVLGLGSNQISNIDAFQNLKALTKLFLYSNQITEISVLEKLTELDLLALDRNRIVDIECLKPLEKLSKLDLSNNAIQHLPNWVSQSKMNVVLDAQTLFREFECNLFGNPIENVPLEIIDLGNAAIRGYMDTLDDRARAINEIKVLFLGEGASGKTSLMKRFCGESFNQQESQTHGINIKNQDCGVQLKMWDFGGQDIMHHTHQFFLTHKSIYVLVLNAREKNTAEYWLRMIEVFGGDSPILIVMNKIDENPSAQENMKVLNEKYPNICGYVRLSCQSDEGLEDFRKLLIQTTKSLLHVKTRWGASWLKVKEELEAMRGVDHWKDYISYEAYQTICEKQKVTGEQQEILIQWLNRLGIVTYFEDSGLNETNVINPEWLTDAFYAIINDKTVAQQAGLLRIEQLPDILDKKRYVKQKYAFLLNLMVKFELCQKISAQTECPTYLFPDLLDKREPEFEFNIGNALKFRFHYDSFLPKAILPKFIVRRYHQKKEDYVWRSGIVIQHDFLDAVAFVRLDDVDNDLNLFVDGPDKRGFLYEIVSEFNNIHQAFQGLKYTKMVPCVCNECTYKSHPFFFDYDLLQKAVEKGKKDYPCNQSVEDVPIRELLGILYSEEDIAQIVNEYLDSHPMQIKKHLKSGNVKAFVEYVKELFASIPYLLMGKRERDYHVPFHLLLRSVFHTQAQAEVLQNKGRMDNVVETEKYIYIFELKHNDSVKAAMKQIHDREYYKPYLSSPKTIILVGILFTDSVRNIADYASEPLKRDA